MDVGRWHELGEEPPTVTMEDLQAFREAGLEPAAVAECLYVERIGPAAMRAAVEEGIDSALLDGAL